MDAITGEVVVMDPDAQTFLWTNGCYGKAVWSRGAAEHVDGGEPYALTPEETLFLVWGLGTVCVKGVSIQQLWNVFTARDSVFVARYAAYHHYRTRGYVVKSGLKYGCDFVLYRDGPEYGHSDYSVCIVPIRPGDTSVTWTHMLALLRVSLQVRKHLVMCMVELPLTTPKPDSVKECVVSDCVLARWSPQRTRD